MPKDGGSCRRHHLGFSQDENQKEELLTLGFITKARHWLARDAAEWSGKTSWKECTCRSASGNRAKGNAHSQGSEGFQEKGGLRYLMGR